MCAPAGQLNQMECLGLRDDSSILDYPKDISRDLYTTGNKHLQVDPEVNVINFGVDK